MRNRLRRHKHLFHTWATLSKGGPCMKQGPVYRGLVSTPWWRPKNDVTENHGAARSLYILCSRMNAFKLNYKYIKRSRNYFEKHWKVWCFIVYELTADFLVVESWFWMSFVVGNRFQVDFFYLKKYLASNS